MSSTNIIVCRLCQHIFLEPVIFPCGHTFCLECSEKWRKRQRVCPQTGCGKPLGEAVPNLLVKEAAISHHTRKIMKSNHQQEFLFQQEPERQQQFFTSAIGMDNQQGRRTEIHQMPSKPAFSLRRSFKAMFSGRPKETIPKRSTEDLALGKPLGQDHWDGENESQESTELASHPMNKLGEAKKDKSLWSKTKHIFSSNVAKK